MKNIDKKIEETLAALDGISPAEPRPFFYGRLQARMEDWQPSMGLKILRPAIIMPVAFLVVLLSAVSIYTVTNQENSLSAKERFVQEYSLNETITIY